MTNVKQFRHPYLHNHDNNTRKTYTIYSNKKTTAVSFRLGTDSVMQIVKVVNIQVNGKVDIQ